MIRWCINSKYPFEIYQSIRLRRYDDLHFPCRGLAEQEKYKLLYYHMKDEQSLAYARFDYDELEFQEEKWLEIAYDYNDSHDLDEVHPEWFI